MSQQQRIIVQNLTYKTTTNQLIFDDINLTLNNNKTGLIGKNGIGKSTLVKLIAQELQPTSGTLKIFGKIAYCPQDFSTYSNITIAKFFAADKKLQALANISQGSCDPNDFADLAEDWNIKEDILQCTTKFSYEIKNFFTQLGSLSNGEITKLWLAKLFFSNPQADYLILDEPTNNLDITARATLYAAIKKWQKGMLVISHDQELLETMDQIITLTERGISIYGGNYSFYKEQQILEQAAKEQHLNDAQKFLKKTTALIQTTHEKHEKRQARGKCARKKNDQPKIMLNFAKNRGGRTEQTLNKQAQRLIDTAEKNLKVAKANLDADYQVRVSLPKTYVPKNKIVATLENISFRYTHDQDWLFNNFKLTIQGPEHIAICGENGCGKTTLLKLIQKILTPANGTIEVNVPTSYLDQRLEILQPQLSIIDNYKNINANTSDHNARTNLAKFLFRNDHALKKVASLSSGEKIRAALACVLLAEKPPELLMLDEPTNHLDLENLACLTSILQNFEGALVIISHDKKFLDQLGIDQNIILATNNTSNN